MTLVKICGLRDPETALEAARAGADFVGLMFAESKRKVTPQECYDIVEALKEQRTQGRDVQWDAPRRGEVSAASWYPAWADAIEMAVARWRPLIVGVFADQPVRDVNEIAEAAGLDLVQLSGGEDDEFVRRVERPVIRVVHVAAQMTAFDINDAAPSGYSAALMLDTASAGARGGTGESFDWELAGEVGERTPCFVAGGLTPENVAGAVRIANPWAVDVSSGVETDGKKDIEKIRAFIRAAKGNSR
ncbi:MAG: phosphoribosylanthranilate isomerase [Dehalococcoidia bacterium]|nr:phosphoribosylanthranilate isomerase [Dehalococcoidia bacterium]